MEKEELAARPFAKAAVLGLGLIGGSLAKALRQRAGIQVAGLDIDEQALSQALADGVIEEAAILDAAEPESGPGKKALALLSGCDIVFICTPPATVARLANLVGRYTKGLITDVASVKEPVMDQVFSDRFIGGHPMAGKERQGYRFSDESLFENAVYALCVPQNTSLPYSLVKNLQDLVRKIGAVPYIIDAARHDRAVATVSHLPHVAAAGLALLAARTDDGALARLAAGGFRDISRIASADPFLWAAISCEARAFLLPALTEYIEVLQEYASAIQAGDKKTLERLFFQAAHYRNNLPAAGKGALAAPSTLTVYVDDKPGVLGQITTLLGENEINISNIKIKEQRAYEGGCLQLLLADAGQAIKAAWLLEEAGYECD